MWLSGRSGARAIKEPVDCRIWGAGCSIHRNKNRHKSSSKNNKHNNEGEVNRLNQDKKLELKNIGSKVEDIRKRFGFRGGFMDTPQNNGYKTADKPITKLLLTNGDYIESLENTNEEENIGM